MKQNLNCRQLSTKIDAIKEKKMEFEEKLNKGDSKYFILKTELLQMIHKLEKETWPFGQEELSREKLKATYEQFKVLFETSHIIEDGQISETLLPQGLKGERFLFPTENQFLKFIDLREEKIGKMVELGLVEPIIVPIAAKFGRETTSNAVHDYTGLLGILAKKLRMLDVDNSLKNCEGNVMPTKVRWADSEGALNYYYPIFIDSEFQDMLYSFKDDDGTISKDLTQEKLIEKHKETNPSFPGFAIYFKEKGRKLKREREKDDPLYGMNSNREVIQYKESLEQLAITGSTAHAEITMLLSSLYKDGRIMRDYKNENDAAGILGGNSFFNTKDRGICYWLHGTGQYTFGLDEHINSYPNVVGVAMDELI